MQGRRLSLTIEQALAVKHQMADQLLGNDIGHSFAIRATPCTLQ